MYLYLLSYYDLFVIVINAIATYCTGIKLTQVFASSVQHVLCYRNVSCLLEIIVRWAFSQT